MVDASSPLILVMAGGTGGHVYPALAVARELEERGFRIAWVGTDRGLEARVVPAAGFALHVLPMRGVRGKRLFGKLLGVLMLLVALCEALVLVFKLKPVCVLGMGGYASGPAGAAAWLLRKPLLVHEQNAVAGTTNRLLAPLATEIVAGFAGAFKPAVAYNVLGNPVRAEFIAQAANAPWHFSGDRPLRLLVVGGSLGAKPLNELVPEAVRTVIDSGVAPGIEVWHQCGAAHGDAVRAAYTGVSESQVRVSEFVEDMATAYAWADVVVCRAGALTVAELAIMRRPALLVPLPHAIDDHQTANARALADVGAGVLLKQSELSAQILAQRIEQYLRSPEQLAKMSAACESVARPKATQQVADRCEALAA